MVVVVLGRSVAGIVMLIGGLRMKVWLDVGRDNVCVMCCSVEKLRVRSQKTYDRRGRRSAKYCLLVVLCLATKRVK